MLQSMLSGKARFVLRTICSGFRALSRSCVRWLLLCERARERIGFGPRIVRLSKQKRDKSSHVRASADTLLRSQQREQTKGARKMRRNVNLRFISSLCHSWRERRPSSLELRADGPQVWKAVRAHMCVLSRRVRDVCRGGRSSTAKDNKEK